MSDHLLRIPPQTNVEVSDRALRLLDSQPMQRLSNIRQLGLVHLVYPGAVHSRFEHSLGVYHWGQQFIEAICHDSYWDQTLTSRWKDAFLAAALLHDVGHWPYCHVMEDMGMRDIPRHEDRAEEILTTSEIAHHIERDWECTVDDVVRIIQDRSMRATVESSDTQTPDNIAQRLVRSFLSGPIDVDKLDYLQRDSLHCGVPYGSHFDAPRLVSSLAVEKRTGRLAIGAKGQTAAEMMVFARYVMFSEVYWHHAVRSASAMLQWSLFHLRHRLDWNAMCCMDDHAWIARLRRIAEGSLAESLVEGIFGDRRRLHKRFGEFHAGGSGANSVDEAKGIHGRIARKPYPWLVALGHRLRRRFAEITGAAIAPGDVIVDAPPAKLEVNVNLPIVTGTAHEKNAPDHLTLGDVSPVVSCLSDHQFDECVKKVRIFVRQELRDELRQKVQSQQLQELVLAASDEVEEEVV